ncbi:hypothetical protein K466DRAFT_569484 [Polyporus arcularius HHB13444]|uniref:Uncharacterized protein n=1 Tax=Polyporus arcularius HHB13444 TaxID=1314778 RepID=A0A5C3NTP9_9APHY|nr:hypothetical protein K466DRAFT_569484 [Polyporus arcularius HHB13444]
MWKTHLLSLDILILRQLIASCGATHLHMLSRLHQPRMQTYCGVPKKKIKWAWSLHHVDWQVAPAPGTMTMASIATAQILIPDTTLRSAGSRSTLEQLYELKTAQSSNLIEETPAHHLTQVYDLTLYDHIRHNKHIFWTLMAPPHVDPVWLTGSTAKDEVKQTQADLGTTAAGSIDFDHSWACIWMAICFQRLTRVEAHSELLVMHTKGTPHQEVCTGKVANMLRYHRPRKDGPNIYEDVIYQHLSNLHSGTEACDVEKWIPRNTEHMTAHWRDPPGCIVRAGDRASEDAGKDGGHRKYSARRKDVCLRQSSRH